MPSQANAKGFRKLGQDPKIVPKPNWPVTRSQTWYHQKPLRVWA